VIDPTTIQSGKDRLKNGLYESYYFRGNSDCGQSFWLKHNLMLFKKEQRVRMESIVILFDKTKNYAKSYKNEEFISIEEYEKLKQSFDGKWINFKYQFKNGYMQITPNSLKGEFQENGSITISWNLKTKYSNETYYHFSDQKFYTIGFPKKKILTKDIGVFFEGEIVTPTAKFQNKFYGMNGHNWGTEHAYKYIYANCNQFVGQNHCYFDGFSAQILLGKLIKSPLLSGCSLKIKDNWYHFNNVLSSWKHNVKSLALNRWVATFKNENYILELMIDGESVPWVTLKYDHPSKKISNVHNTKYANGTIKLIEKKSMKEVASLKSSWFELESLIPNK